MKVRNALPLLAVLQKKFKQLKNIWQYLSHIIDITNGSYSLLNILTAYTSIKSFQFISTAKHCVTNNKQNHNNNIYNNFKTTTVITTESQYMDCDIIAISLVENQS